MLPINIRLAGQLVMQVFKYRYICNHVATLDEDNKVMTGYYNHFRTVMYIIICMVGYNVFNVISVVIFLIKFFKWEWEEIWLYWWVAEALCSAFEEAIILYAVVMLYQIECYFEGEKFRFLMITVVILLRFFYSIIQTFVINYLLEMMQTPMILLQNFMGQYIVYVFQLVPSIIVLEFLIRFPMLFSFVRSTQRVVSNYINEFLNDMNTDDLDRQHFVDKVLAGKLFQIAGWGTIVVSFMTSFVYALVYGMLIFILSVNLYIETNTVLRLITVVAYNIIQVFTILPSISYCIFLTMLWLYFRDKTKVKYSGYNSDDPEILQLVHRPKKHTLSNQDEYHFTFYKSKYRVMNTTYALCIVVISVLFAGFFAPLLGNKWTWDISLAPGDYYRINRSMLENGCPPNQFNIQVKQNTLYASNVSLNCSEDILAGEILQSNEIHNVTFNYKYLFNIWLPENSVYFHKINSTTDNYNSSLPYLEVKSQFPCYNYIIELLKNFPKLLKNFPIRSKEFGKDSCKGAELVQESERRNYAPECVDTITGESKELNCTIKFNGEYKFASPFITIKKFRYAINESNSIRLEDAKRVKLHNYDIIVFNSSMNITSNYEVITDVCSIHATCSFPLAFRILMPVPILLSSMLLLTIGLILIKKI